jgi:dipeptidyl-peptidase 4
VFNPDFHRNSCHLHFEKSFMEFSFSVPASSQVLNSNRKRIVILGTILIAFTGPHQGFAQRAPSMGLPGTISAVQWDKSGEVVQYTSEGQRFAFNLKTLEKTKVEIEPEADANSNPANPSAQNRIRGRRNDDNLTGKYVGQPARGRQYTQVISPDDKWEAVYRDWNLVLIDRESKQEIPVTTDGNEAVHYGTASWVYGEELDQNKAIWWTADSKKVLYYRFDDSKVKLFYLVSGWSEIGTEIYPEHYPKAGAENPAASLFVYDLNTKKSTRIDVGGGPEEYIYGIRSSPDGKVMLVNWTDRLQRHLKVLAIDLETGNCRTVVEEKQKNWQANSPPMLFLADNERFVWPSDKSGYTHYELRNLKGDLINGITKGEFQTGTISVDEKNGLVNFTAFSSSVNPYYLQYHLVGLDGTNQRRVTTIDAHHSNFSLSPDNKWLIAQYEEVNTPPCTALYSTEGKLVAKLAESDPASAANLAEMFSFKSSDGKFDIYGILFKPRDFDPSQKYPVVNSLYGGPGSNEIRANYVASPQGDTSRGYLVVRVNNRGTGGRGKAFTDATYGRLGDIDIQDHADAIRLLSSRPYFDGQRVGIVGHSYGGYLAAMGIFKHPDVYSAAVIRAGVTDWRNYDSIYTERYMSTPQLNPEGYKIGAAMTYVKDLKGKVLIMHGMMDDNVHPNNAFQLIDALDRERKPYESRFWPNGGHGLGMGVNETQQEFFDRVLKPGFK